MRRSSRADPIRRAGAWALLAGLTAACSGEPTAPLQQPRCEDARSACRFDFAVQAGRHVPVFASRPLDASDVSVARVLVIVHGTNRNADDYFETGIAAVRAAGLLESTLVVAPRFRTADDAPPPGDPRWTSGGWKRGHLSVEDGRSRVSSYEVLDELLAAVTDDARFPAVRQIVVAGHSAGGQVVHRYAAGSALPGIPGDVPVRFVVANPSTYLYPSPERWIDGAPALPAAGCPDYDRWHYGFDDRNTYMRRVPIEEAVERLLSRDVRVLLGAADTLDAALDVTCGALLQGRHRLERGRFLGAFLDAARPGHRHRRTEVAGVGHSSRAMLTSARGRSELFGG